MTTNIWDARRAEFNRVAAKTLGADRCFCGKDHQRVAAYGGWCCPDALSGEPDVTADELEACAAKLLQRARDIRHTERLNAMEAARAKAKKPRCPECDETSGETHLGWCSFNGPEAWTVVE